MGEKLLYETEPYLGYQAELESLARHIEEYKREAFDFTGYTIVFCPGGINEAEVFIEDGEWMRGLVPSNVHLQRIFELMRDALIWRLRARDQEGWLKQLIKKPWRIW